MTSTSTSQGLDITARPSSKVLKPPGGGSSDIFGSQQSDHEQQQNKQQARRNVKNHLASNLFLSDEPSQNAPTPSKTPGNSFTNLFGPPAPPRTPMKTPRAPKDQLNLQDVDTMTTPTTPVRGRLHTPRPESNGGDAHDGGSTEVKTNGNVATMNGTSAMNGNVKPMTNGNAGPVPATNGNAAPRQRVPPGGYSSGLW